VALGVDGQPDRLAGRQAPRSSTAMPALVWRNSPKSIELRLKGLGEDVHHDGRRAGASPPGLLIVNVPVTAFAQVGSCPDPGPP